MSAQSLCVYSRREVDWDEDEAWLFDVTIHRERQSLGIKLGNVNCVFFLNKLSLVVMVGEGLLLSLPPPHPFSSRTLNEWIPGHCLKIFNSLQSLILTTRHLHILPTKYITKDTERIIAHSRYSGNYFKLSLVVQTSSYAILQCRITLQCALLTTISFWFSFVYLENLLITLWYLHDFVSRVFPNDTIIRHSRIGSGEDFACSTWGFAYTWNCGASLSLYSPLLTHS